MNYKNGKDYLYEATLTDPDIDGGTADNVTIGGSTPAPGSFTTIKQTTGAAAKAMPVSDASGNLTLTAEATVFANIKQAATTSATGVVYGPYVGASTFAGSTGQTITHSLGHQNYKAAITPTADPGGYLGEVYIVKADNTIVVYNSGTATGAFEYIITPHAA